MLRPVTDLTLIVIQKPSRTHLLVGRPAHTLVETRAVREIGEETFRLRTREGVGRSKKLKKP